MDSKFVFFFISFKLLSSFLLLAGSDLTEDYIWAMRTSFHRDSDSELWKERRAQQPLVSSSTVIETGKNKVSADDNNVKVMASLVPDEIIYNVKDYSIRKYDACLLFGDVSGKIITNFFLMKRYYFFYVTRLYGPL